MPRVLAWALTLFVVFASSSLIRAQLADTVWAMHQHDALHTGQSPLTGPVVAPSPMWQFTTGASVYAAAAIGLSGEIYIGSTDSMLYSLNPGDGTERWHFDLGGQIFATPLIGSDGTLYCGSTGGIMFAINTADGTEKWRFTLTGDQIWSSATMDPDGATIYFSSLAGGLYALHTLDGSQKWNFPLVFPCYSSPALSNGILYITNFDSACYAINALDGSQVWYFRIPDGMYGRQVYSSPVVGPDDTVYFTSYSRHVYALDLTDGSEKWHFDASGFVHAAVTLGLDGTVFIGTHGQILHALDPTTGNELWQFATGGMIWVPAIIGLDGTLHIASEDHNIYALNPTTGSVIWQYDMGSPVLAASTIGAQGTLYFGCEDNVVYAVYQEPCPSLPQVVWTGTLDNPTQLPPAPTITTSLVDGNLQFSVEASYVNEDFTWLIDFKSYSGTGDLQGNVCANRAFDPVKAWNELWERGPYPGGGSLPENIPSTAYPENPNGGVDEWRVYGVDSVLCNFVNWIGTYTLGTLTSQGVLSEPTSDGSHLVYDGAVHVTAVSPVNTNDEGAGVYLARFSKPFSIVVDEFVTTYIDTAGVSYDVSLTLLEAGFEGVTLGVGGQYVIKFRTDIELSSATHTLASASVVSAPTSPSGPVDVTGPTPASASSQEWELRITFSTGESLHGEYVLAFVDNVGAVLTGTIIVADHLVQVDDEDEVTVGLTTSLHLFPLSEAAKFFDGDLSGQLGAPITLATEELYVLNRLGGIPRDDSDLLISLLDVELCPVGEVVTDSCDGAVHPLALISDTSGTPTIDAPLKIKYGTRAEDDTDNFVGDEFASDNFLMLPGDAPSGTTSVRDSGVAFLTAPLLQEEGYGSGTAVRIFVRTKVIADASRRRAEDVPVISTSSFVFVVGASSTQPTPGDGSDDSHGGVSLATIFAVGAAGVVAGMGIAIGVVWRMKKRRRTEVRDGGVEFEL